MRALKLLAALSMMAALAGVVVIAGVTQLNAYLVRPGPTRQETVVVLPRGAGLARIAAMLNDAGVIEHPWMFRLAARVLGHDRELKAGEYAFPAAITPGSVLNLLGNGQTVARRLMVAEGLTVAEIYQLLEKAEGLVGELPPPPPEGSLLPETYFYAFGDRREDLVRRMRRGMQDLLEQLWPLRARGMPLVRPEDAVTLASIVDKETGQPDERRKIAAVFINRLRSGMRLQADPTVIYGLTEGEGRLGRALTRHDWTDGSAYNTYHIEGLPPGPIGNPGRASIEAVLNPAAVDYLYFVASGNGGHAFARTLAEHNRNVAAWRKLQSGEATPEPPPAKPDAKPDAKPGQKPAG
jgi:peptidoglycan lytic transglycosylase G